MVFLEQDAGALAVLRANVMRLAAASRARVVRADAFAPPRGAAADLVFLDPPYATGAVPRAVDALARAGWIGPATLVCAEQARTDAPPPGELLADRTHGGTRVLVLRGSSAA